MREIKRRFIVGDSWLYFKLYTGTKMSDTILTEVIRPVINSLENKKLIDKWFFIRYSDPEHHLRIRFHCIHESNIGEVIKHLNPYLNKYIDEELIWNVKIDIYDRELERYGYNTIEVSEDFFHLDSIVTIKFLTILKENNYRLEVRWLFALKIIDSILDCFQYSLFEKLALLTYLREQFGNEFGMNRDLKQQLDKKYRINTEIIEDFMNNMECNKIIFSDIYNIVSNYKFELNKISYTILNLNKGKKLELDINDLLCSYIHMSMNRIMKSKNRVYELVCYDFLSRYYKSKSVRSR